MRRILIALLFPCAALAQQPAHMPTPEEHARIVDALVSGRDALTSQLQNEIAGLKVLLERAKREAEAAKKDCKPEGKK